MSDNIEIISFKTNEKSAKFVKDTSSEISMFIGSFDNTLKVVNDGQNLGDPFPKTKSVQNEKLFGEFRVYTLGQDTSDDVIIYIHGGGYLFGLYPNLVQMMDVIAQKTSKQVYILDYGLPMKYNWVHAYTLLNQVYDFILSQRKKIIIIGDSAGGGLGLGFIEYLNKNNLQIPIKQILISPWLDITMSNPQAKKYDEVDPLLDMDCLIKAGKIWSNGLDTKDYRLSPIFGDLSNIPDTLITTGTLEVMYPDIIQFSKNLSNSGTKVKLIICEGMYHAYPVLPSVETDITINYIADFINK